MCVHSCKKKRFVFPDNATSVFQMYSFISQSAERTEVAPGKNNDHIRNSKVISRNVSLEYEGQRAHLPKGSQDVTFRTQFAFVTILQPKLTKFYVFNRETSPLNPRVYTTLPPKVKDKESDRGITNETGLRIVSGGFRQLSYWPREQMHMCLRNRRSP